MDALMHGVRPSSLKASTWMGLLGLEGARQSECVYGLSRESSSKFHLILRTTD